MSVLNKIELTTLRRVAESIWCEIGYDCMGSWRAAENASNEDVVQLAFDAGRLRDRHPDLHEIWATAIELDGYTATLKAVAGA